MAQGPVTLNRDEIHLGYVDFNKNEGRNFRLHQLGADPGSPVNGQLLYRTDTNKIRARVNAVWVDVLVTGDALAVTLIDAKGDLLVGTANDTIARKAVGADGTALFADSAQGDGLNWRTILDTDLPSTITRDTEVFLKTAYTTKGDVAVATGSGVVVREGVGADNTFLVAASGQATGRTWRVLSTADLQEKIATTDLTDWPRAAALDLNSQKITSLADGTVASDAATWGQVQTLVEGRIWKDPVDAATTGALPALTYSAGAGTLTENANGALPAQDGVTLAVGDDLLVKNQASSFQNGIYTVTALGSGAAVFVLTRRADASTAVELRDATVMVEGGTTQGGDLFTQTVSTLADLTAATQTWTKTGDTNTVYTADGTTIELVGNSFRIAATAAGNGLSGGGGSALAVNVDGTTIEISADTVRLAATAAGNGLTGGGGAALDVGAGNGISVTANAVAVDPAVVVRKFTGALTGGANSEVITHNLNTRDIAKVTIVNNASPFEAQGEVYWEATSVNTITIYAASGQTLTASYRVIVIA